MNVIFDTYDSIFYPQLFKSNQDNNNGYWYLFCFSYKCAAL